MVTTVSNPSLVDPALTLPQANVRGGEDPFPEDQFVTLENVPVFAEHKTTAKDGRELNFTQAELEAVANRCNRRIQETGDYAALVFGHTPDPDDSAAPMPDLCGFAGPFRLGVLGDPGTRQRYAILADFHVFKDELPRFRKHPRRSPEVWLEDSYAEMFLDPIALLGAEPPRLDMGLLYSAARGGRICEKYTAVAPAAGNVFIPSDDLRQKCSAQNAGSSPMLAPDDIRQIVDAIEALDWVQFVKDQMASQAGPNAGVDLPTETPPAAPAAPDAGPEPGGLPGAQPPPPAAPPAGPPSPPAPDAAQPEPSVAPPTPHPEPDGDEGPPAAPGPDEEREKLAAMPPRPNATANAPKTNYAAGEGADEGEPPYDPDPDAGPESFEDYCRSKYGADANATGEYQTADQQQEIGGSSHDHAAGDHFTGDQKKYQADGSADGSSPESPAEGAVEPSNPGPAGTGSVSDTDGEASGAYQDAQPPAKFSRDRAELQQLRQELGQLKATLDEERGRRVDAERYSALADRRQAYVFDLDREMERCKYGRMSGEQFNEHLQAMEENYRPLPIGGILPTHLPQTNAAAATAPGVPGHGANREHYSKERAAETLHVCERLVESGKVPGRDFTYEGVREQIEKGQNPLAQ